MAGNDSDATGVSRSPPGPPKTDLRSGKKVLDAGQSNPYYCSMGIWKSGELRQVIFSSPTRTEKWSLQARPLQVFARRLRRFRGGGGAGSGHWLFRGATYRRRFAAGRRDN
jgi:hypothetical protein